ncbi:MAG: hypothetical protein Q9181_001793, partial [Wetmoreana brouardii]
MSPIEYDFIIVGSGPCGSSLAARLSSTLSKPSILLIEAGKPNQDPAGHTAGARNTYWATGGLDVDYGYKTTPQAALNDRELPYHRGKCLGGSTATNIGVWDYGSGPELDEWARLVGDECWAWENVRGRMREIESYHDLTPERYRRYVHSDPLTHDLSSEKCIGMGVSPATVLNGHRVTAASAYLANPNDNLHILPNTTVSKVTFEGKTAKGVQLLNGEYLHASKEILLCAGAIDTPKLLLLSGIGPVDELARHGIPTVLDQPNIGTQLKDHPMIRLAATVKQEALNVHPLPATADDIAAAAQGYLKIDPAMLPALSELDED